MGTGRNSTSVMTVGWPSRPCLPNSHTTPFPAHNQDAGIIADRQVLTNLIKGLTSMNIPNMELCKAIVEDVLSVVQLRATSYEEQVHSA